MADSLEQLDPLLLTVAKPRKVCADSLRFQGMRYTDPRSRPMAVTPSCCARIRARSPTCACSIKASSFVELFYGRCEPFDSWVTCPDGDERQRVGAALRTVMIRGNTDMRPTR